VKALGVVNVFSAPDPELFTLGIGERDKKQSLNKMVTALSHHWYLSLPSADLSTVPHPECTKLIHIDQSPRQK
jgi:hypothetical protein